MTGHDTDPVTEDEVRAAFRRRFADLDALVPPAPPAVRQPHRDRVNGTVTARWAPGRSGRRPLALVLIAAAAIVALIAAMAILPLRAAPGPGSSHPRASDSGQVGRAAYDQAANDVQQAFGANGDLVTNDPKRVAALLEDAYTQLAIAEENDFDPVKIGTLRNQVVTWLNIYDGVPIVVPQVVASFAEDELTALVLGPDGAAYVIDRTAGAVYWVDLATGQKHWVAVNGQTDVFGTAVLGAPSLLATGGPDILVLDDKNQLWRWRTVPGRPGLGTLVRVLVEDFASWGEVRAMGVFVTDPSLALYSLFVLDSSAGVVIKYSASPDGTGYYAPARSNSPVPRDMPSIDDMYVDGSVYLAGGERIARYNAGQEIRGWAAEPPPGKRWPHYAKLAADSPIEDVGNLYAYDSVSRRVVVVRKIDGMLVGQFALPPDVPNLEGMFVLPGANGSDPTLYWISGDRLLRALLPGVAAFVPPTPAPGMTGG